MAKKLSFCRFLKSAAKPFARF